MSIILGEQRIVPTWIKALEHLKQNKGRARNVMLELDKPNVVTQQDKVCIGLVDTALREHCDLSIQTVAGTIFPQGLYKRAGAAQLKSRFFKVMERAQKKGTWGTYAMRLMCRPDHNGNPFNPLQRVVDKLKHAAGPGNAFMSNYELSVHGPDDLTMDEPAFCEVPLYSPARDSKVIQNYPCLSHLTFKLVDGAIDLTAIYRSHWYAQRALGNLIGLSHLMDFVAAESGTKVGRLTCISTDATLDWPSWGGVTKGKALMAKFA